MFDIYEYTKLINDHPNVDFLYDPIKDNFIQIKWADYDNKNHPDYRYYHEACLFPPFNKRYLENFINPFIKDNKNCFANLKLKEKLTLTSFNKTLDKLNLKEQWLNYLIPFVSEVAYSYTSFFAIKEKEATKEQYLKIGELLKWFRSDETYLRFSEDQLFRFFDYDLSTNNVALSFLGYYGGPKGLSFYIHDLFADQLYNTMKNQERYKLDEGVVTSTTNLISFYFDEETMEPNPFGDKYLSSISVRFGTFKSNYLTYTLAVTIIKRMSELQVAISKIRSSISYESKIDPKDYSFINLTYLGNKKMNINIKEPHYYLSSAFYPYSYRHIKVLDNIAPVSSGQSSSFAIKAMPEIAQGMDEESGKVLLYALIANNKTGLIEHMILGSNEDGEPLEKLSQKMYEYFLNENINTLNRTFYVGNEFDESFLRNIFPSKFKIYLSYDKLATDKVYEEIMKMYEEERDEIFVDGVGKA